MTFKNNTGVEIPAGTPLSVNALTGEIYLEEGTTVRTPEGLKEYRNGAWVTAGVVTGIDTSGFEKDEPLWIHPVSPGELIGNTGAAKAILATLTDEQRMEVFSGYCCQCGSNELPCHDG